MYSDGYSSSRWQEEESLTPLKLKRTKIVIELEVYATVTDYNAHQITLSHPDMDGSLTFDVNNLQDAEDTLDQLEVPNQDESSEEEIRRAYEYVAPKPHRPEPPRPTPPQRPQVQETVIPPKTEPPQPTKRPEVSPDDSPVGSVLSDVAEICDLLGKLHPRVTRVAKAFKK
jgi:hypothetical protein